MLYIYSTNLRLHDSYQHIPLKSHVNSVLRLTSLILRKAEFGIYSPNFVPEVQILSKQPFLSLSVRCIESAIRHVEQHKKVPLLCLALNVSVDKVGSISAYA